MWQGCGRITQGVAGVGNWEGSERTGKGLLWLGRDEESYGRMLQDLKGVAVCSREGQGVAKLEKI